MILGAYVLYSRGTMQYIIVEARVVRVRISRETIQEFIRDIADYLNETIISEVFEYLEDGSVGFAILDHGHITTDYLMAIKSIYIVIYYRVPFEIKELSERINLYFIPKKICYREVK